MPEFGQRLWPSLEANTPSHEIIFAMDTFSNRTEQAIREARTADSTIKLAKLSHQRTGHL